MLSGKRVVAVIPAGRRQYMDLLIRHLSKERDLIDEVQMWSNSIIEEDVKWMQSIADDYFKYVPHPQKKPTGNGLGIHPFYLNAQDENTVYVRFDDDIVWIEPGGLKKMLEFRLAHPEFWLVAANIVNNAICSHIHQRHGALPRKETYGYACMDPVGWQSGRSAEVVHQAFLNRLAHPTDLSVYRFPQWILYDYERFSINCISWLGADLHKYFGGKVDRDEEHDLAVAKPIKLKKPCVIFGDFLVAHYSFHTQRSYLDNTDVLKEYGEFAPSD